MARWYDDPTFPVPEGQIFSVARSSLAFGAAADGAWAAKACRTDVVLRRDYDALLEQLEEERAERRAFHQHWAEADADRQALAEELRT